MHDPLKTRPLAVLGLWLVLGCALFALLDVDLNAAVLCAVLLACTATVSAVLFGRARKILIRVAILAIGAAFASLNALTLNLDAPVTGSLTGRVCAYPEKTAFGVRVTLDTAEVNGIALANKVQLFIDTSDVKYGDIMTANAALEIPETRRNPGGYNLKSTLAAKGVSLTGTAKDVVLYRTGASATGALLELRATVERNLTNYAGEENGALLTGVLFGDTSSVGFDALEDFRTTGTAHVLAVSGLHVGLLGSVVMWLLRRLRLNKWLALAISATVLYCYAVMAGFSVSVTRAAIMCVSSEYVRIRGERPDTLSGLGLAAALQTVIQPAAVTSLGFFLSYGAVLGIASIAVPIASFAQRRLKRVGAAVLTTFAVSFGATVGTLPATLYAFGRLPLLSLVWNAAMVPMVGLALGLGLFGGALGIGFLCGAGGGIAGAMRSVAEIGASVPLSSVTTGGASPLMVAAVLAMALALSQWVVKRRVRICAFVLAALLVVASLLVRGSSDGLRITALDVGNGDALVIRNEGRTVLIDGGMRNDYTDKGASVVLPYLRYEGIDHIDAIVMTHGDSDHAGGLAAVANNVSVGTLLLSGVTDSNVERELISICDRKGILVTEVKKGDVIAVGDAKLEVLWPQSPEEYAEGNNGSLVLKLTRGGFSALFMADVEAETEARLYGDLGETTLLKVGHHGSNTSTTEGFVEEVKPKIALVSASDNFYGNSNDEVITRLKEAGALVYSTAECGAVTVKIERDSVFVETMLP